MKHIILIIICFLFSVILLANEQPKVIISQGHIDYISSEYFSPDGKYLLTGSMDRTIILWDIETGKAVRNFPGHNYWVYSVCLSPDGKYALSNNHDTMRLWDVKTGAELRSFSGHSNHITSICFSPDGKYALSGSWDKTMKLWDIETGENIRTFSGHTDSILIVCFSPDGNKALSYSGDKTVKLWNIATGTVIWTHYYPRYHTSSMYISLDGKYALLSTSYKASYIMRMLDMARGKEVRIFSKQNNDKWISRDEKLLIVKSGYKAMKFLNKETGKEIMMFTGQTHITDRDFSSAKYTLSYTDSTLKLLDITTNEVIKTFYDYPGSINSVCFSPDGKYILSGREDGTLKLWDLESVKIIRTFSGHKIFSGHRINVSSACFSPDGKYALSSYYDAIKLWNVKTGKESGSFYPKVGAIVAVNFSPDGKYILSGGYEGISLWDIKADKEIWSCFERWGFFESRFTSMNISPDGRYALAGGSATVIKLWDLKTGEKINVLEGHLGNITAVSFSPDGKYALSGSYDKTMKLWNIKTGEDIRTFSGHTDWIYSVCFSPDGKYALSGCKDKTMKLWQIKTGEEIKTYSGHRYSVNSVCFSPDGKYALSGSTDGSIKLWETGNKYKNILTLFAKGNDWILFTDDGYYNCSQGGENLVHLVDGFNIIGIDQFAILKKRPDIILNRIDCNNKKIIAEYYNQYSKRLIELDFLPKEISNDLFKNIISDSFDREFVLSCFLKSGNTCKLKDSLSLTDKVRLLTQKSIINYIEDQLKSECHVPTTEIISTKQTGKKLAITFHLKDPKYKLYRYNIYINTVPLFGTYGKQVTGHDKTITEEIKLSQGKNRIEISCLNEKATESSRVIVFAEYKGL